MCLMNLDYVPITHLRVARCSGLIWSWAVGMGDFELPPAAGIRTGAGHVTHVILEVHYDNPGLLSGVVDDSGFRFYHTTTLRDHDVGTLQVGDGVPYLQPEPLNP